MSLETGNFIGDLVPANPTGADPKAQGDDHIRLLKRAVTNGFPGFNGPVLIGGAAIGGPNDFILNPATALIAYAANSGVVWIPPQSNTGAVTLNISNLGPRNVRAVNGAALSGNDLVANVPVFMIDTGTEFRLAAVTKNYIDGLAFGSELPTPPAGNGSPQFLIYVNGGYTYTSVVVPDFLLQAQGVI